VASQEPSASDDLLRRIDGLIAEEHHVYHERELTLADRDRLDQLSVEVDRLWDKLRRLRAMRRTGRIADQTDKPARAQKRAKGTP
jgi:hypothetical protein